MKLLNSLERKFGNLAITNLTYYLIIGQVMVFVLLSINPNVMQFFALNGNLVIKGEWWRIITFLFFPLSFSPIFAAFIWYLNYIFGTALEHIWGSFRFTLYFFIGYIFTIVSSFVFPKLLFSNGYIFASFFFAYAYLNPDFMLNIFFVIPIKIKWLAYLSWAGILIAIFTGSHETKILSLISVGNFLLFFGEDIVKSHRLHRIQPAVSFMHCATCGKTEHDKKIFSYCHDCSPQTQYCEDHIKTHKHLF